MIAKEQRHLEQQILRLLDQIIDEASQVSMMVGPYRDERFAEGVRMMEQLLTLCELLVEGRKEYVEATIRQLFQQKLPQPNVLRSFGEFQSTLEEYLQQGLQERAKAWEEEQQREIIHVVSTMEALPVTEVVVENEDTANNREEQVRGQENGVQAFAAPLKETAPKKKEQKEVEDYTEVILLRTLQEIYPHCEVVAGSPPGTTGLAAYVPAKGFAILCASSPRRSGRREYICRQLGLQVIYIANTDLHSPLRLKRRILRAGIR
ncbi:hypothetical protein [Heliorestis convoluta]|uniref:Uncharacterized protein n=1 Tax=Heliorestis convoluta TaxID=356322 RepID=A0A5Q2N0A8_9FIRM|nr:hypothetical protein [Heliorestis convoluta]QGG46956.1 hypothetical protein FTV88_0780 [Heliorestis convoluta]